MASVFRSRRPLEPRSGGKIVRPRRTIAPKTPYDRPTQQFINPPHENPNWISRLILSPTRMVVNGAGKLLSAVFNSPDSYSSSSSSAFASVSVDSIEDEDDYGTNEVSSQSADILGKRNGAPRTIESFRKDCQPIIEKDNNKHALEQLLMQETFTREECNKLIKIIKSRVVDHHATDDHEPLYKRVGDTDKRDLCSTAIMEARKWLIEKKVGSASKSKLDNGVEDEMGSPVDMAKSFMRQRPLWESPSFNHGELKSSSPLLAQLSQIETPCFIHKIIAKPKSDTPTSGSWNIQEEIQRLRAKATENMLMNLPSKRIDCSVAHFEKNMCTNSLSQSIELDMKDKMQSSRENADTSLCMTAEKSILHELQALESTQLTQDGLQNEASPDDVNIITQKNQDLDATQITNGKGGPKDMLEDLGSTELQLESSQDVTIISLRDADAHMHGHEDTNAADQQLSPMGEGNMEEPISQERNSTMSKELTGSRIDYMANDFPSSGHRLTSEVVNELNDLQTHGQHNLFSSIDNMATGGHGDETCEFLTSVDFPNRNDTVYENGSIASSSQNGLVEDTELLQVRTRPTLKRSSANKTSDVSKPQAKRLTRYSRRSRGRGK